MSLCVISFTKRGLLLSERIAHCSDEDEILLFTKCREAAESWESCTASYVTEGIGEWTQNQMKAGFALLFIGACGIAVRAAAPCVRDKLTDSPVLVMDEQGRYVIPILSGHMGGANEMAVRLADRVGAEPVITTATDINRQFAVDLFARRNGLHIVNKAGIARVSSKVLAGEEITIAVEEGHLLDACKVPDGVCIIPYPPAGRVDILVTGQEPACEALICLKPKEYVIGIGCRKGKKAEKIEAFISASMAAAGISQEQIAALASIDRKSEEEGLRSWSRKNRLPFLTFSAQQLARTEGDFNASSFVMTQVGVDNVCERAAIRACGADGRLVYRKHAEDGMTIAIARRKWSVSFNEE